MLFLFGERGGSSDIAGEQNSLQYVGVLFSHLYHLRESYGGQAYPENHWWCWNHKPYYRVMRQSLGPRSRCFYSRLEWCISAPWCVQIKRKQPNYYLWFQGPICREPQVHGSSAVGYRGKKKKKNILCNKTRQRWCVLMRAEHWCLSYTRIS